MNILPRNPERALMKIAYVTFIALVIYFIVPKVFVYTLPFLFAYAISKIITPISEFLHVKFRIQKKFSIIVVLLLIVGLFSSLIFILVYQAVYEVQKLALAVPSILNGDIEIPGWMMNIKIGFMSLPAPVREFGALVLELIQKNLATIVEPATRAVISAAGKIAGSLPNIVIFIVVMIMSAYFMCSDGKRIREFFATSLPERFIRRFRYIKTNLFMACGGYLKAQLILMCVTFIVVLSGLGILGADSAVLVSFIVAVVDAIPILGTGTILIPWAVVSVITGKYFFALGLLIIYGISFLIRRIAEPKIVSQQIGLHPLVTLISLYIGLISMGVVGMVLGPIAAIIIINFFKAEQSYEEEMLKE